MTIGSNCSCPIVSALLGNTRPHQPAVKKALILLRFCWVLVWHVDNFVRTCLNQVIENCPVTGIQVRTDELGVKKVKAVETPHGTIETPCVVNCAGAIKEGWTKRFFNVTWKHIRGNFALMETQYSQSRMHFAAIFVFRDVQIQTKWLDYFRKCLSLNVTRRCVGDQAGGNGWSKGSSYCDASRLCGDRENRRHTGRTATCWLNIICAVCL